MNSWRLSSVMCPASVRKPIAASHSGLGQPHVADEGVQVPGQGPHHLAQALVGAAGEAGHHPVGQVLLAGGLLHRRAGRRGRARRGGDGLGHGRSPLR